MTTLNIVKAAQAVGNSIAKSEAEKQVAAQANAEVFVAIANDVKAGAAPDAIATGYVTGYVDGAKKAGKPVNLDTLKSRKANIKTVAEAAGKTYGNRAGYDLIVTTMMAATAKPDAKTAAKVPGSLRDAMFRGTAWLVKQAGPVNDDDLVDAMRKPEASLAQKAAAYAKAMGDYYHALVAADELDNCPAAMLTAMKTSGQYLATEPHTERKPGKGVNWAAI